jgi:hypothetical protein
MLRKSRGFKMKPFGFVVVARSGYSRANGMLRTIFFSAHPTMKLGTRRVGIELCCLWMLLTCRLAVLHQCALERDLTLFEAGDKTEVGEKGLTLR